MEPDTTTLTAEQVAQEHLEGWTYETSSEADSIVARVETGDFVTGLALVNAIGAKAEEANHHPDIDLRYPYVEIRLTSHDAGGVTSRDVAMAKVINALSAESTL
ncbi:4a-hydroxytetrahydrobiopterin dehydratase [Nocardioides sp.]|jgi:4a-hydroxytetrahydrobiopterin dehydratase|uniref:4a-hydroxytetrahydrobiopterin dehydratase n=1 Tax=Nocardioides sp. TaxID=35761 RepID=UPI0019BE58E2|nr:4a-hydroxytetrahydrobiopterin dehydratase [Nocardioides sp.]MBC7275761.1 4a-hydroxytetrahydrobiopterin dehydratase [Nocardioides sp.]